MAAYRETAGDSVIRTADGACIPHDERNRDWRKYQAWLADGNTPDPYVAPPATFMLDGLVFLARLSDSEYTNIVAAANSALAQGNGQLSRWIDMLRLRGEIDLAGDAARAAKASLVASGLLTQARADAIFSAA